MWHERCEMQARLLRTSFYTEIYLGAKIKGKSPPVEVSLQRSPLFTKSCPVFFALRASPNWSAQSVSWVKRAGHMLSLSSNKLAEFITASTPARRKAIVRQTLHSQHTDQGYAPYYQSFKGPAKTFLIGGAVNPTPLHIAAGVLAARRGSRWHKIDNKITTEALVALAAMAADFQALNVAFVPRPEHRKSPLSFGGIAVKATPDLLVRGERNGVPLLGGLRFYLAKDSVYHLGPRAAELVATMEYLWLRGVARGSPQPDTSVCLVAEILQGRITGAPDDPTEDIAEIEQGCRDFAALWQLMGGNEAA